jgi:hypothetical protein
LATPGLERNSPFNLYNKRACPSKIQEQKKKKSTTATFWEAIFLRAIFLVKSHLHESSLTEKREERDREKERKKERMRHKEGEREMAIKSRATPGCPTSIK